MNKPLAQNPLALLALLTALAMACGPGDTTVEEKPADAGVTDGGQIKPCTKYTFYRDADGDGYGDGTQAVQECEMPAGYAVQGGDCDDTDPQMHPGAVEKDAQKDYNCDGKAGYGAPGVDYDGDGHPGVVLDDTGALVVVDCNDNEPLVGPDAVEVPGDGIDNNCDGRVDEVVDCSDVTSATATSFARAMGVCGKFLQTAQFFSVTGVDQTSARKIRTRFGEHFFPHQPGGKMIHLSSGRAVDNLDEPTYSPQGGTIFSEANIAHPLWSASDCYPQTEKPSAHDVVELRLTMKVPQNAKSFSYRSNFFSAEYPEFVCTKFNDRFVSLLSSAALDPTKLPGGAERNCTTFGGKQYCNVSYDSTGQPLSINSGFFDICQTDVGNTKIPYTCGKSPTLLAKTGFDRKTTSNTEYKSGTLGPIGGATGWLTTSAPVIPGETITLRLIIFDEGDSKYDSAVLIDNFQWEAKEIEAPVTIPIG